MLFLRDRLGVGSYIKVDSTCILYEREYDRVVSNLVYDVVYRSRLSPIDKVDLAGPYQGLSNGGGGVNWLRGVTRAIGAVSTYLERSGGMLLQKFFYIFD